MKVVILHKNAALPLKFFMQFSGSQKGSGFFIIFCAMCIKRVSKKSIAADLTKKIIYKQHNRNPSGARKIVHFARWISLSSPYFCFTNREICENVYKFHKKILIFTQIFVKFAQNPAGRKGPVRRVLYPRRFLTLADFSA